MKTKLKSRGILKAATTKRVVVASIIAVGLVFSVSTFAASGSALTGQVNNPNVESLISSQTASVSSLAPNAQTVVVQSVPVGDVYAGDVLDVSNELRVANSRATRAYIGTRIVLANSPTEAIGSTIAEWNGANLIPWNSWTFSKGGVFNATEDLGSQYVNVVAYASNSPQVAQQQQQTKKKKSKKKVKQSKKQKQQKKKQKQQQQQQQKQKQQKKQQKKKKQSALPVAVAADTAPLTITPGQSSLSVTKYSGSDGQTGRVLQSYRTPAGGERTTALPIRIDGVPSDPIEKKVVYSVKLDGLQEGETLQAHSEFLARSAHVPKQGDTYWKGAVLLSTQMVLAASPDATTGVPLNADTGFNLDGVLSYATNSSNGSLRINSSLAPLATGTKYLNVVAWSGSHVAVISDPAAILNIVPGSGQLSVIRQPADFSQ